MFLKRTLWFLGIALWLVEPFTGPLLAATPAHAARHCVMKTPCQGACCCKAHSAPTVPCDAAPGLYAAGCGHPADQSLTFPGRFGKVLLTGTIGLGITSWIRVSFISTSPIFQPSLESPTPPPEFLP